MAIVAIETGSRLLAKAKGLINMDQDQDEYYKVVASYFRNEKRKGQPYASQPCRDLSGWDDEYRVYTLANINGILARYTRTAHNHYRRID